MSEPIDDELVSADVAAAVYVTLEGATPKLVWVGIEHKTARVILHVPGVSFAQRLQIADAVTERGDLPDGYSLHIVDKRPGENE